MQKSESIKEIAAALAKFQEEVKQPEKSADNPFFKSKYVPLESVVEVVNQFGPKNGLSFTQWPSVNAENRIGVSTLLMHTSGEWIEYDPIYMKSAKDDAQGAGSVITYLKRYSLSAIYGITSDEDDDGNHASGTQSKQGGKQQTQNAPPPAQQNTNVISPAQIKAIGTKTGLIAKNTGKEQLEVYQGAQMALGINKSTRDLTKSEASKFIEYLSNLE